MTTSSPVLKSYEGPSSIKRAKFGPGMLLQHEDLEQLNTYTRDLSRLLFRSFFGCGVVCGLTVSAKDNCGQTMVTVDAGVALNCLGDPIYVPKSVTFAATDGCDPDNRPSPLYVWLCSCPKCCAPRTPSCGCGCDSGDATPACTREVDWYEIHLGKDWPKCACGCCEPKSSDNPPQEQPPLAEGSAEFPEATGMTTSGTPKTDDNPCHCVNVEKSPCYANHYAGVCGCKCEDSNCVILAKLTYKDGKWTADHCVRRFIRPVLVRDPACPPPATDQAAKSESTSAAEMLMMKPAARPKAQRHKK